MKRMLKIYLEKPELAGFVLLVILSVVFDLRSNGIFLGMENMRASWGSCRRRVSLPSVSRC